LNTFNQIRHSIGLQASDHPKIALFLIALTSGYGFFHFGLEPSSWLVTAWRIIALILLFFLLISPFSSPIKTKENHEEESSEPPDQTQQNIVKERNNADLEIIKELSDQFYVKSKKKSEKDFTLFLTKILTIINQTFAANTSSIFLLNQNTNKVTLKSIVSNIDNISKDVKLVPGADIIGIVLNNNSPCLINNIENAHELLPYYNEKDAALSVIAAPITIEGEIIGVLTIDSTDNEAFNNDDIQLVEIYSGVFAEIMVNFNNLFEFENSVRIFSSFYEVSRGLNSNLKFEEIIDLLVHIIQKIFQYDRITIVQYEPGDNHAKITRVIGQDDIFPKGTVFPIEEGLTGWVIRKQKPLRVADIERDEYFMPRYNKQEKTNYKLRSFLAAPISYNDLCFGAVCIECCQSNQYKDRHERVLTMLANNFGVALERSYMLKKLESLATTDGLTGLYNYRSFIHRLSEEIERALRYNLKFSLLLLDLDFFKKVNDTYGHLAGDLVLKKIAEMLKAGTRTIDFIARYGGEEFTIILIESNLPDSLITAERIRKSIENMEIVFNNEKIKITISIGAVEFSEHQRDPKELMTIVDNALYRAKKAGRNRIVSHKHHEESETYIDTSSV